MIAAAASSRSVVPAEAGTHAKVLFLRLKWIPAFAGMTLRSTSTRIYTSEFALTAVFRIKYQCSASAISVCPEALATSAAFSRFLLRRLLSAPAVTKARAASARPSLAAIISAVLP